MKSKKFASIHFSTRENGFTPEHKAAIISIINSEPKEIVLVHAFASREFLAKRNIAPDVLDFFDKFFKEQICFFNAVTNVPDRIHMFDFVKSKNGTCFFLGDIDKGVEIEHNIATSKKANIVMQHLSYELVGDIF